MTSFRNALYNFLLRKENVCCLCFEAVETNAVRIDDEFFLNNDTSSNVELSELLDFIFGSDAGDLASETVCKQCVISALYCYTFIKKCKENFKNFQQAIDSLDNCLQNATEQIHFCKSLFISLDANFVAKEYYDYKRPVTTRSVILKRFKTVSNKNHANFYLQDVKNEDDFDADIQAPTVKQATKFKHKKNTKHRTASLPKDLILHKDSKALAYKCNSCLKTFQALDYLRQHYLRIHAPKTFKCSKCDRSYGSYTLLEQHVKDCHETKVCVECGKTYSNRYSLKQHELGHRLRFVCQKCGRVYKNKDTFKQHIEFGVCGQTSRKSATEGRFKCDICNKQFSRKNTLSVHIKFEHSEKGQSHVCSWCNKKFSCQSRLKAHTVKHTQEKNFACDVCGGKFVTKESLLYHTRIHTGEKPYECSACGQRFLSSSRRAEHVRRHHTNTTLSCDVCNAKFKNHSCLMKHKQRHSNPQSRLFRSEKESLIVGSSFKLSSLVVVISEQFSPATTGDGSGGLWYPYCCANTPQRLLNKWGGETYKFLHHCWLEGGYNVCLLPMYAMYREAAGAETPEWASSVFGYRHLGPRELAHLNRLYSVEYGSGHTFTTFVVHTSSMLSYLYARFTRAGGRLARASVTSLRDAALAPYDVIVNCAGLGARTIVPDARVFPVRGQVMRVEAPWLNLILIDESSGHYIIPNAESCVLGGTRQENDFNTKICLEDTEFILNGCCARLPALKGAKIVGEWAGLRPARDEVRVEAEERDGTIVIHNYGHGGSGVTLFWGCASDVLTLLEGKLNHIDATSKSKL